MRRNRQQGAAGKRTENANNEIAAGEYKHHDRKAVGRYPEALCWRPASGKFSPWSIGGNLATPGARAENQRF